MLVYKWVFYRHPVYSLLSVALFLFVIINFLFLHYNTQNYLTTQIISKNVWSSNSADINVSISEETHETEITEQYSFYNCLPYASYAHANLLNMSTKIVKPKPCSNDVSIVLLIKSSIFRNSLRTALRKTWAKEITKEHNLNFSVRRFFLVGSAPANYRLPLIETESYIYKDILQGTFEDTYKSVASKVLLGMKFVQRFCSQAKFVVVVDDDSMIFPWNLFTALTASKFVDNLDRHFYAGFLFGGKTQRAKTSRWRLSEDEYSCDFLPPYAGGSMYVLSVKSMITLYQLANIFQPIHLEDVYFGVLAHIASISINAISYDYINSVCLNLLHPHGSAKENNLNLFVCHEADLPKDQEDVWKEYCFRPVYETSLTDVIHAYCSN